MNLVGRTVIVPEPNEADLHNHEFIGIVIGVNRNGCRNWLSKDALVMVIDQDDNVFEIELDRLQTVKGAL